MIKNKNIKGFTLIELLITIGIVGVLAVISIPLYDSYSRRAKKAEAEQELMNLASVQEDYLSSYRRYSNSMDELKGFYGVKNVGAHFKITMVNPTASSYTATANICYNGTGTSCNAGDTVCTISNGQEKPTCTN